MHNVCHALAFDMGASGCKVLSGQFDGQTLHVSEAGRFPNTPVWMGEQFSWDTPRLLHHIKQGMVEAHKQAPVTSFALDSWGTSMGLIDSFGTLLALPRHYRDLQFRGIASEAYQKLSRLGMYQSFGVMSTEDLSIYQCYGYKQRNTAVYNAIDKMMLTPDLLRYFLTGEAYTEETIASTGGLIDPRTHDIAHKAFDALGIDTRIIPPIIKPATKLSGLSKQAQEELGINPTAIAAAGHDTASAVLPLDLPEGAAFLSCGTWNLLGVLADQPYTTQQTLAHVFSNELSPENKVRFLRNIPGMWLYAECLRQWQKDEPDLSHDDLTALTEQAKPFVSYINVEDPRFGPVGDMPARIAQYCIDTHQPVPQGKGEYIRCILQSLALKLRESLEALEKLTSRPVNQLMIVGGGTRNRIYMQMAANATKRPVHLGAQESSGLGNILAQLVALGEVQDFAQARQLAAQAFPSEHIAPQDADVWDEAYQNYRNITRQIDAGTERY